jgi:hypothetical protein
MKPFGLTTEQTIDASHVVGLAGAALTILVCVVTGFVAVVHNWLRTTATDPAIDGWTPPDILVWLCLGLIAGATVNEFLNLTKPSMLGTTSMTTSVQTSSTVAVPPTQSPVTT